MWELRISKKADKDIEKLDHAVRQRIIKKLYWLRDNIENISHERLSGI
jgi:mRNA-degrading endonuclease RelE of RelBE toxin-antitoxin system